MRRRRYATGVINPFLPTEAYVAKLQAHNETGSLQAQAPRAKKRDDRVVTIRINPLDCLSILDYMERIGESTTNMSFAQCVKIVLASSLKTFRGLNYIPEPDGFAFLERMAQFEDRENRVAMLNITAQGNSPAFDTKPLVEDPEARKRKVRLNELNFKYEQDPMNMATEELAELEALMNNKPWPPAA